MNFKRIVEELCKQKKTISTMESCTGGAIANAITNIEGVSDAFKFSAVTYSNEYKIKMGVAEDVINEYSVYSIETAQEMAKSISKFTNSNYGIGITGKLNRFDKNNNYGQDNEVFISIYNKESKSFINDTITVKKQDRESNKELVIEQVIGMLEKLI